MFAKIQFMIILFSGQTIACGIFLFKNFKLYSISIVLYHLDAKSNLLYRLHAILTNCIIWMQKKYILNCIQMIQSRIYLYVF